MVLEAVNDKYSAALGLFNAGNFEGAESLLSEIVAKNPDFNTEYFLAVVKSQLGKFAEAVPLYEKVLEIMPRHPEANFNIALSYQRLKDDESALKFYHKALEVNPNLNDAYNNIAYIHKSRGNILEAENYLVRAESKSGSGNLSRSELGALTLRNETIPAVVEAVKKTEEGDFKGARDLLVSALENSTENKDLLLALGHTFFNLDEAENAFDTFEKVQKIDPENPIIYYSLGVCLQKLKREGEAVAFYQKAIELKPDYPDAINNLGLMYYAKKDFPQAEKYFNQALQVNPDHINAIVNLGSAKTFQNDFEGATAAFELAIEVARKRKDSTTEALINANLGFLELRKSNLKAALNYFDVAIDKDPNHVLAHYNKAETLLKMGKFKEGWKEYEWRIEREEFGVRKFYKMLNSLEGLEGKRVYVYGEQGLGDTLHFIRYLKLLKERNCHIIFECEKGLHRLLTNFEFIDEIVAKKQSEKPDAEYDFDVPLLNLPRLFETDLFNIPNEVPYLRADNERKKFWGKVINSTDELKVGVVWAGSTNHPNDRNRSVRLSQLSSLFSTKGVQFFSLQKGISQIQLKDYALLLQDLDEVGIKSWADTAGIIENLDLVITVDTSVAHLAGAMGKPVWVMIPFNADWRWMTGRDDSPWYPTMRLYNQKEPGNWTPVFKQIAADLNSFSSGTDEEIGQLIDIEKFKSFFTKIHSEAYPELHSELHSEITEEAVHQFIDELNLPGGTKVLDVGCGNGKALELFRERGFDATGITISNRDLQTCKDAGFNVRKMDQNFLNFQDEHFDLLWVRHTLEHSVIPMLALSEFKRVLKLGGRIYIEVPAPGTNVAHINNPNHYSVLTAEMWEELFRKTGLNVVKQNSVDLDIANGKDRYLIFMLDKGSSIKIDSKEKIYLALTSGENFGWGVCSKYLKKELPSKIETIDLQDSPLSPDSNKVEGKVFHALKNHDFESLHDVWGTENFGYTFFEHELNENSVKNSEKFDKIIAGSTWCEEKMQQIGINNTGVLIQGIDPELFYPAPKQKNHDLFVIFSGGKMELRKGQDLVLKAFQTLQNKYPDMILMNAWYNIWPQTMDLMKTSPHIKFEMKGETWKNKMINLCRANGIDGERVFTLPLVPNEKLREVYQNTDLGLFPNRCEGGTNLVLMEYMACGKPVVASYNTGHKDVLTDNNSLKLTEMSDFTLADESGKLIADWKEPSLDEIIAKIEWAYNNRDSINEIGMNAGNDMKKFTWTHSADKLIELIS